MQQLGEMKRKRGCDVRGWCTDDDGGVIERVADDEAAFADEGGDYCAVGCEAHAENNGGRFA